MKPGLRDYAALAATTASGGLGLLLPLYLTHQGHSVGLVGVLTALGAVASLLSRIPLPLLYRPSRSRQLLLLTSVGGMVSSAVLPFMPDLVFFTLALLVNRVMGGLATSIYLARYLDMIGNAAGVERRRVMGYYGGTQAAGYAASSLFSGLLADYAGFEVAFLFTAAASGVAAAILITLPNPTGSQARETVVRPRPAGLFRGSLAAVDDPGLWGVLNVNTWNHFFHTINGSFFPVLATAVGLPPAQIGLIRALYSGVNAVSRPVAWIFMGRLGLRQIAYVGIGLQAALLFAMPFVRDVLVFIAISAAFGLGRAVVVVATSAGLAEEVDDTRVSRGMATATYSTSADVSNIGAPLVGGLVASLFGIAVMFPVTAVGFLACFVAGDVAVARWRARRSSGIEQVPAPAPG
ncbi:MAG: transporter [Chloroflexi bacterium]|nr:transporter [Chloroflexota bacterium]